MGELVQFGKFVHGVNYGSFAERKMSNVSRLVTITDAQWMRLDMILSGNPALLLRYWQEASRVGTPLFSSTKIMQALESTEMVWRGFVSVYLKARFSFYKSFGKNGLENTVCAIEDLFHCWKVCEDCQNRSPC